MVEAKPFRPVKLIVGIISSLDRYFIRTEAALAAMFGPIDLKSDVFRFEFTDYYDGEMGKGLRRMFLSFVSLIPPEALSSVKAGTNSLEKELEQALAGKTRPVNIDPGILTASALFMATTKDFSHRVPLREGIYAHLELQFTRTAVHLLPWSYPDFRQDGYQAFFLEVRRVYLEQLRKLKVENPP